MDACLTCAAIILVRLGRRHQKAFLESMISSANILVYTHRVHLGHDHIDNLIVSRMNKRFMERARREEAFTHIIFNDALSD